MFIGIQLEGQELEAVESWEDGVLIMQQIP